MHDKKRIFSIFCLFINTRHKNTYRNTTGLSKLSGRTQVNIRLFFQVPAGMGYGRVRVISTIPKLCSSRGIDKFADSFFGATKLNLSLLLSVMCWPFKPHDASEHHFTSIKTDLTFLRQRVLEWNSFTNTWQFSLFFHVLQIIFIHYKSRIVGGKFRLERVNLASTRIPLSDIPYYATLIMTLLGVHNW